MEREKCSSCIKEPTDRINVGRFIDKLDSYLKTNDLEGAKAHVLFWEKEAEKYGDNKGLLSVVNEELGLYRRTGDKDLAETAVNKALLLLKALSMQDHISAATILVNTATTMKFIGNPCKAIELYGDAEQIYRNFNKTDTFEFAALLNNKAASYCDLNRYDDGEICYREAIEILNEDGKHDGEIAVSYINLAHLYFDRDDNAYEDCEKLLDLAWEYINSEKQPHDANYAFILSKCAPSLRYFGREDEANAVEEVSREIYERD